MRTIHIFGLVVLLAFVVPAAPARAGGVVTVCDEAHLLAALADGGTVTFACSGTITLTAEIVISADTTIDGSGQAVFISGGDAVRVFTVIAGVTFNVNGLTVANGEVRGYESGGGIYMREGTLTVSNSTFFDNHASSGGGIYLAGGVATLTNSTFTGNYARAYEPNSASTGGGILNEGGTLHVSDSVFSGNSSYGGGGAIDNRGRLTVGDSVFSGNEAFSGRWTGGGGIGNWQESTATVSDSTFFGNSASGYFGAGGGGIYNYGVLDVSNSTFVGNSASAEYGATGGGIENGGRLILSNSTFFDNSVSTGELTEGAGGAISNRGALAVSNSTLSDNSAAAGGGIWNGGTATLKNTIVANSRLGGNCGGGMVGDGGSNLSYPDATCPGIDADPRLGPLQDNGGPTWTMELGPGSAALEAGNAATCAAAPVNNLDQRGVTRPQGARCDIGAVEHRLPFRKWFPAARLR